MVRSRFQERVPGFDTLRFAMIACVVAMHAAMTYMRFVPPWWYVIDARQSVGFSVAVVLLDSFPMSVLFLLAGYFAPASLAAAGAAGFLKSKLRRLGVPWVLGVALVCPFLARASAVSLGNGDMTLGETVAGVFLGTL